MFHYHNNFNINHSFNQLPFFLISNPLDLNCAKRTRAELTFFMNIGTIKRGTAADMCFSHESNESKTIPYILVHTNKFGMREIKTRITYWYGQNY